VTDTQAQRCGNCNALLLPTDAVHYPARRGEVDAANPMLGTVIDGKYRLQSVLGRGGLGTVFRAQHVGSLVTVALKLLHPRFAERPEYRRALLPEARRAATVIHEHCARLLDVGEGDEGITYLAMELVEGQTLEEVLQEGPLNPVHALDILLQVADALSAVHQVGLVHCDLSPRNVMISAGNGRLSVKVLDFGIARSVEIAGKKQRSGELWGFASPAFSAPELLAGGDVDERADLYSLGTLAWLMLTGTMPVDDSDRERSIQAVREGRLLPWPGAGVPRALVRLVMRCLSLDRDLRPESIGEVQQRLLALRAGPRRLIGRITTVLAAVAAALTLLVSDAGRAVFLRPQPGSPLQVSEGPLARDALVQDLRAAQLATVEFHYGGLSPKRLVAEIVRGGKALGRAQLTPDVDEVGGTLALSVKQPSWRELVSMITMHSREGPLDLTFIVPGVAVLGAGRLRLDEVPPKLEARFDRADAPLRRDTRLTVDAADEIGVARIEAEVRFSDRPVLMLPLAVGSVPFGALLAEHVAGVQPVGAGEVLVRAVDYAGNVTTVGPRPFAAVDVSVPEVLQVTGPAGQRALSRSGDRLRFRVQLSAGELGLELRCQHGDNQLCRPLQVEASSRAVSQSFDVDVSELLEGVGEFELTFIVVDPIGNEAERTFPVRIVDRSPEVSLQPIGDSERGRAALFGTELVVGPDGGAFQTRVAGSYKVIRARVVEDGGRGAKSSARLHSGGDAGAEVVVGPLGPGVYSLWLELKDRDEDQFEPVHRSFRLRALPQQLEVRVPTSAEQFVPQLVDAGLLTLQGAPSAPRVVEGIGWRYDSVLRPYMRGACYRGGRQCASVSASSGLLLAGVPLQPGYNELSLALVDALGRPVRVLDERGQDLPREDSRTSFASFWWSDEEPRIVGERLLVEHGRPLRVRVSVPLPFDVEDRERLRLGLGNGEWPAVDVEADGGVSQVAFDVPFAAWSAAAQLAGVDRKDYAQGVGAEVVAYLLAPSGRSDLALPLLTTRSTLSPLRLGSVAELPLGLQDLQLLPVLAPDGRFEEPVSAQAPPRATYRPQPPTPVRNMPDILLQDRELSAREARALADYLELVEGESRGALVHAADPLGRGRLLLSNLLPAALAELSDEDSLCGVDFFQAWTLTRLLGVAVGGDPELFRLPLGCELELAAYAGALKAACSGVVAHGGDVRVGVFGGSEGDASGLGAVYSRAVGDVVPTDYDRSFVGLDFGLREWVLDLPHMVGAELLLREWTSDHSVHLSRMLALGAGVSESGQDPLGMQQRVGVVRGFAFGEVGGLVGVDGRRLRLAASAPLPACVPGVLRTEQLRRDGQALLGAGRDARLRWVGFRVAGDAEVLAKRWGYR